MNVLIAAATKPEITSDRISNFPILITGAGMVNTAINLTKELNENNYDLVINMGVSGSFSDEIKIGDVVEVIEDCFSEIGFEYGESFSEFSNFDIKTIYKVEGRTSLRKVKGITVNTVHGNEDSIHNIIERLHPDIESMEGAAVFKVCEEIKVPCIQIRSISNKIERRNKENWDLDLSISNLNTEVEKIINNL
ncbi:MAG TPA: futalosine hydrolase [Flavobacteriales bacterium]|jgi:futalosine hydrolase|nr:futalosine hydrolase [Flavobacteriales bacterium]|tara:strand:- start:106 stop:684 length:579 start_codon:yes stop_codon:yes gene_type:complete